MEYNHVTVSLINAFPDCCSNSTHTHRMLIVNLSQFHHNNLSHGAPISSLVDSSHVITQTHPPWMRYMQWRQRGSRASRVCSECDAAGFADHLMTEDLLMMMMMLMASWRSAVTAVTRLDISREVWLHSISQIWRWCIGWTADAGFTWVCSRPHVLYWDFGYFDRISHHGFLYLSKLLYTFLVFCRTFYFHSILMLIKEGANSSSFTQYTHI